MTQIPCPKNLSNKSAFYLGAYLGSLSASDVVGVYLYTVPQESQPNVDGWGEDYYDTSDADSAVNVDEEPENSIYELLISPDLLTDEGNFSAASRESSDTDEVESHSAGSIDEVD